jgi:spermidine/putrescine transport system ATP-binding protein
MTCGRNIAFGLDMKGKTKFETEARVNELLEFMQLEGFKDRKPDELSGGQRQRIALARALAPDPRVLLLDEPLGALDAKLRKQVQIELKAIQQRTEKTFIFVTHDQEEALTMSDSVLVMNEGRIEQIGAPKDLYSHPENRFVAGFIGETNMLECVAKGIDGKETVLDWGGIELRGECRTGKPAAGQDVGAVIRPENITCYASKPGSSAAFELKIDQRVFKGSSTTFQASTTDGRSLTITLDSIRADEIGDETMWVALEPEYLSVLLS